MIDTTGFNKVAGAILTAGIAFMIFGLLGETLVHEHAPKVSAIKVDVPVETAAAPGGGGGEAAPPAAPEQPFNIVLASADPGKGEAYAKKVCAACHSFNEGGKAGVGPNLYGVVGGPHAHMVGFNYSDALKGKTGPWTFDELNKWLTSPKAYAPGTRMSFAGIADEKTRADVVDYLHTLAANPEPLPAAK